MQKLVKLRIKFLTAKYTTTQQFNTTGEFNKLTAENFAARLIEPNLVSKTDFDNKLISFNRKITSNETKYLEVLKKLYSLTTKNQNFFLGKMYFTSNDGSQRTLHTLELKKDKDTDYILSWKSKGVSNSKFKSLSTAFLHSIKISEYRFGIKFDKDTLAVEQNNYLSKTVNVYIAYNLDAWPRNPINNFKFKTCLFAATNK